MPKHDCLKDDFDKAVLATDLAVHMSRRPIIQELVTADAFQVSLPQHRQLLKSLLMTCADLFSLTSSWQLQNEVTRKMYVSRPLIRCSYEEFFNQGDLEKELSLKMSTMTTRVDYRGMAKEQVRFMESIVSPAFKLLADIVPDCRDISDRVEVSVGLWRGEAENTNI